MRVFEIHIPGDFLESDDKKWSRETTQQIDSLVHHFFAANLALNMFEEACESRSRPSRDAWEQARERTAQFRGDLERGLTREECRQRARVIEVEAEKRFKREQWANGQPPWEFEHGLVFIYARDFLHVLSIFESTLAWLAESNAAHAHLGECARRMKEEFPTLREVRNSSQHIDERSRGLGRDGKPLELKPRDSGGVQDSAGSLGLSNLHGSRFGFTMADGNYGEVDVSERSLELLSRILHDALNGFRWTGWPRHRPS